MRLMHDAGHRPPAVPSISGTGFAPRPPRAALGRALRKWRRLAGARAPRRVQLVLQSGVLPLQPRPLLLQPLDFIAQLRILTPQLVNRSIGSLGF